MVQVPGVGGLGGAGGLGSGGAAPPSSALPGVVLPPVDPPLGDPPLGGVVAPGEPPVPPEGAGPAPGGWFFPSSILSGVCSHASDRTTAPRTKPSQRLIVLLQS